MPTWSSRRGRTGRPRARRRRSVSAAAARASAARRASARRSAPSRSRRAPSRPRGGAARSRRGRGSRSPRPRRRRSGPSASRVTVTSHSMPPVSRAHLRQRHPADLGGHPVRAEPVEERLGAGPGELELREARLVEHADARADRPALLADRLEPVAAAEGVLVPRPRRRGRTRAAAPSRSARRRPRRARGSRS